MKSFMAAVRHFSLSPFAVISVHILLSSWHEGSVSAACLCAPAQTGLHSILSSCRRWGTRGDKTPVIVDFLLCSLPLLPTRAHWQCEQSHLAGELSAISPRHRSSLWLQLQFPTCPEMPEIQLSLRMLHTMHRPQECSASAEAGNVISDEG